MLRGLVSRVSPAAGRMSLGVLSVAMTLLFAGLGASSAFALSPWWHLNSGSRPAYLHSGVATDEVQELKVSATTGDVLVEGAGRFAGKFAVFPYNAEPGVVQAALEGLYGAGNLEVSGGPVDATESDYVVRFKGELGGQPVPPMQTEGISRLACDFNPSYECLAGEANTIRVVVGRADGEIVVTAANLGDASTNGEVKLLDRLPAGLRAVSIEEIKVGQDGKEGVECSFESPHSTACTFAGTLTPYEQIEVVIGVDVEKGASSGEANEVSISGGEAPRASISRPIAVNGATAPFGVEDYEMTLEEEGGGLDTQAGSHPFQLTTTITFNQTAEAKPVALVKDLNFKLPPGLIGNPTPVPQCTLAQFFLKICPPQTAVGVAMVTVEEPNALHVVTITVPVFNLEPSIGEPARFAFLPANVPVFLDTSLRTGSDYGVTVSVDNISEEAAYISSKVTFWGVPGDPRHDDQRSWECLGASEGNGRPCHALEELEPPPFLIMPTACPGTPMQTSVEADSWAQAGVFGSFPSNEAMPATDGCNRLPFSPSIKVTPDGQAGSTPTGLTVDEHVPQEVDLNPTGLSESAVKGLSVTLPEGVALNPAGADGLQACTQEEIGLQSAEAISCPEASKVGTVKIRTPLLPNPLEGAAYLATQNTNPFGSLVALYIFAEDPVSGVRAKATGEVVENPLTGQLTAHFEGDPLVEHDPVFAGEPETRSLPELAFEDVELHFFGGDRAPLATPALCGGYTTTGTFTPWSGTPTTESSSEFQIVSGPNGSPCRDPLPFAPSLTAGTTSIQAGGFSPFTMTMSREDGSQNLNSVQLKMPPGLLGTLSSVKLCPEPQADEGTCGPESLIGHTVVSVGVGGDPYTVTGGEVFITGPYSGAPYGLSIVNPAKAGPFDLGKVIVRAKIEVDPTTAALTITTDESGPYKIPTILDGIPLQIKHVNVTIDRPDFTFNPTNCSPLAITGSLTSSEGATDALSVPFQITNCAVLAFKPKLTASTSGKTSRADGASLTVHLGYPAGPYDANIAKVKVELPKQLPSRLTTLQKACKAAIFESNPAACPAASIVGHATASTPVLPVPLTGPAYFVSHGGEAFPSLVIVLQGYGATVHLVGSTFISKAGITSSTFKAIPDVPVGTFELTLPQGPFSALAANTSLCKVKSLAMPTEFIGQNGALSKTSTKIAVTGCGKAKKAKKTSHKKRGKQAGTGARRRKYPATG